MTRHGLWIVSGPRMIPGIALIGETAKFSGPWPIGEFRTSSICHCFAFFRGRALKKYTESSIVPLSRTPKTKNILDKVL